MEKIEKDPDTGCWNWTAYISEKGRPLIGLVDPPTTRSVARLFYEHYKGDVPGDKLLRRKCLNPRCTNPDHMQLVTRKQNVLMSEANIATQNKQKTHCVHGHPYDEENSKYYHEGKHRQCRECLRIAARKYQAKLAEERVYWEQRAEERRMKRRAKAWTPDRAVESPAASTAKEGFYLELESQDATKTGPS